MGDFRPLLGSWEYEIRDQRPLKLPLLNGQGLGWFFFVILFGIFSTFSAQNYPWVTLDGAGMDPNEL